MKPQLFIQLLSLGLLISGLCHIVLEAEIERLMSRPRNIRLAGAVLVLMMVFAFLYGLYILAFLLGIFALPRLIIPERSYHFQKRLYGRRIHGIVLLAAGVGLWIFSKLRFTPN
jgi:tellurite resistance protein TehA-like permease